MYREIRDLVHSDNTEFRRIVVQECFSIRPCHYDVSERSYGAGKHRGIGVFDSSDYSQNALFSIPCFQAGADLDEKSLYKQFTYAKNIIQLNINIFNKPGGQRKSDEQEIIKDVRYRDQLTAGYNLTPNFFVRGRHNDSRTEAYDYVSYPF